MWLVALMVVLSACGTGSGNSLVVVSSPQGIGVGEQRILVAVVDDQSGDFVASPDIAVDITLRNDDGAPLMESPGTFLWAIPDRSGIYSVTVDFPEAGTYQLTLASDSWGELGPAGLVALEDPLVIEVGEAAPLSDSRTLDDGGLAEITSDPDPDPRLYGLSIGDAVESGPAAVVFASFVNCPEGECGTLLDQVKSLISEFPGVGFVHTDVYEDVTGADEDALLVDAVADWRIPSEPWVFIVGSDRLVSDRFEGAVATPELRAALSAAITEGNTGN